MFLLPHRDIENNQKLVFVLLFIFWRVCGNKFVGALEKSYTVTKWNLIKFLFTFVPPPPCNLDLEEAAVHFSVSSFKLVGAKQILLSMF